MQSCGVARPMRHRPRFSSLPTASGGITRAAYARAVEAGLDVRPLLKASGLTVRQAENPHFRIPVKNQIKFLNLVANALSDDFLGVHLAESIDLRELGLLYYVLASSKTLGDALSRGARYSTINNEGIQISYRENDKKMSIVFRYIASDRILRRHSCAHLPAAYGPALVADHHQIHASPHQPTRQTEVVLRL